MKRALVACVFLALTAVPKAWGQLPTATILGTVRDSSGASVVGADLSTRNVDTGQTRKTQSDADGSYRFDALPVGNYEVSAEHSGFETVIHSGLTLTVAEQVVVDFTLQVGTVAQQVHVTAQAPIVDTTGSSLGGLVDDKAVADLPLNGRNYIQLSLLQSGISELKNRTTAGSLGLQGVAFSSSGAPPRSNNYLLDGASMVTFGGGSTGSISGSTLGLDGILEFRVITSNFSAEYGMTMGSQMVIVSKGGTNAFHGDAFDYLRNSAFDARNYFDTPASSGTTLAGNQRRLPPFRRNNFGGSLGGPIQKDKTFFFGVYEGLRELLGTSQVTGTIAASCRGAAGDVITNTVCPQLGSTSSVTIAPVIAPWLPLFPLPNFGANQIAWSFGQPTHEDYFQTRIDHTFGASDTFFTRYTFDNTTQVTPGFYPGYPAAPKGRSQFLTLSENHILSPTLLNTARFSFSRTDLNFTGPIFAIGPEFSMVPGEPMGTLSIGGVTANASGLSVGAVNFGGLFTNHGTQNIFTWSDDLFHTEGRHSLKFGTLINHYQLKINSGTSSQGAMSFPSLATFLAGAPSSYTIAQFPGSITTRYLHYNTLGFYIQDDFRATNRLTLNLGFRYEFNTNPIAPNGISSEIRDIINDASATVGPYSKDPSYHNFSPRVGFAWDATGDGKTALRGSFAVLYNIATWVQSFNQFMKGPPFFSQASVANPGSFTLPLLYPTSASSRTPNGLDYNIKQPYMLQYNLSVERQLPDRVGLTLAYVGSRGINLTREVDLNPTIPQGVPSVTAGGLETCVARPAGQLPPNFAQMSEVDGRANACFLKTDPRRNPNWGSFVGFFSSGADSWYNALEVTLQKQVTHGLEFQSNFTWSRSFDTTQAQSNGDCSLAVACNGTDPLHPGVDRGPSTFDIPLSWRSNMIYHLPGVSSAGFVGKVLNGWWVSSILQFQSGYPFTPSLSSSRSLAKVANGAGGIDRPDVLPGRRNANIVHGTTAGCLGVPAGQRLGTTTLYFDPCAFAIQPSGFLGNEPRDFLRGPNFQTVDFSLVKDTKVGFLGEAGAVEFRAEVFNILNRANFGLPNRTVFAGTGPAVGDVEVPTTGVGNLTNTVSPSRQIQLALKLLF